MTIKITERKENPVLKRKELTAVITDTAITPPRSEVMSAIAKSEKAQPDCVVIKKISGHYGNQDADVTIFVYNSVEDKKAIEVSPKKATRFNPKEEKKAEGEA